MTDLAQWLLEQIDEDEQSARKMLEVYPTPWEVSDRGWMVHITADAPAFREVARLEQWEGQPDGWLGDFIQHLDNWNPDRVIADCEAKRQLIYRYRHVRTHIPESAAVSALRDVLKDLAARYVDRAGYLEEWRPTVWA